MDHDQRGILTLNLSDGRKIAAPTGVWFLALYDLMGEKERVILFERVLKIRASMENADSVSSSGGAGTNGKTVHSMRADGGGMAIVPASVPPTIYDDTFLRMCNIEPL